jgi:hypothetical protein
VEDGRCQENEKDQRKQGCKGGSEGFHHVASGFNFPCDRNRTLRDGGAGGKDPESFSFCSCREAGYICLCRKQRCG